MDYKILDLKVRFVLVVDRREIKLPKCVRLYLHVSVKKRLYIYIIYLYRIFGNGEEAEL